MLHRGESVRPLVQYIANLLVEKSCGKKLEEYYRGAAIVPLEGNDVTLQNLSA